MRFLGRVGLKGRSVWARTDPAVALSIFCLRKKYRKFKHASVKQMQTIWVGLRTSKCPKAACKVLTVSPIIVTSSIFFVGIHIFIHFLAK